MAVKLVDNFSFNGKKPLDARLVYNTVADLVAVNQNTIYDGICAYVVATQKFYVFNSTNTVDATLDKWRELTTAGYNIKTAKIDNVSTSTTYGHLLLTINDASGTVIDCGNAIGPKGEGFAITKLYSSINDMVNETTPVTDGKMVAVVYTDLSTSNLVAKVYIRNSAQTQDSTGNENGYTYFCNLADATAIQGPEGKVGPRGYTPSVTVTTVPATTTKPQGSKVTFTIGSGTETENVTIATGSTYNLIFKDITPSSISIIEGANTYTDDGSGNIKQGSTTVGTINYVTGVITSTTLNVTNATLSYTYKNTVDYTLYNGASVKTATIRSTDNHLIFTLDTGKQIDVGVVSGGSGSSSGGGTMILGCFPTPPTTHTATDIYFNTTDNMIYTATSTTAWDTGSTPQENMIYISLADEKLYAYDSVNGMRNYGGGGLSISSKAGNAIQEITGSSTPSEDGLYVEDLSNKINTLNIAQKTVNSELEYYYATVTTSISGVSIKDSNLINYLPYLTNITSNLEPSRYNTKGVTLKKAKTYKITFGLTRGTTSGNGASAYIMDSDGNKLGNRGYFGSTSYNDNIIDTIYTPTKDITVYPALVNLSTDLTSTYYPDCSFFQITEVGRTITIDPLNYIDKTEGIEEVPIGSIFTKIGNKSVPHYLVCDGSVHNILDYPDLAEYIKEYYGSTNVFGGDGITTFAVPDKTPTPTKLIPTMTSNTTPAPIVMSASSEYSGYPAYYSVNAKDNYWCSAKEGGTAWLQVDFGTRVLASQVQLGLGQSSGNSSYMAKQVIVQGSNDNTNFIDLVTLSITKENRNNTFDIPTPGAYRYYRLSLSGSTSYYGVWRFQLLSRDNLYYIKAEKTYAMNIQVSGFETLDIDFDIIDVSLSSSDTPIRTLWEYTNSTSKPVKLNLKHLTTSTNVFSNDGYVTIDIDGTITKTVSCPTSESVPLNIDKFTLQPNSTVSIKTNWNNTHTGVTWTLKGKYIVVANTI